MWGNQRGWIISAFIVLAISALLYYAAVPPGISAPSHGAEIKVAMQPANLPVDPNSVLPPPTGDCDAGEAYKRAISDWAANQTRYDQLRNEVTTADKNRPPAVKEIVDASDCGRMTLFVSHPDEVINYSADRPSLDALNSAGSLVNQLALLHTRDKYKDMTLARKLATAAFNLGRHLYEERVSFLEWVDGISLMEGAAGVLMQINTRESDVQALKEFAIGANDYRRNQVERAWEIISGIGESDKAKYSGDIFEIAKSSPDRMWRVEGILKLGRFKFNADTRGDQYGAKRTLKEMLTTPILSSDPLTQAAVHAAVVAASDLSIEEYRMIK